jgi:hypothetical protein
VLSGKYIAKILVLAGMGFGCLSVFASDWDEDSSKQHVKAGEPPALQSKSKFVLRGQVQHSEKMPALGESMQAGANFSPNAIPQAKYESSWFKIPIWFAGTFQTQQSFVDYVKDYATGKTARPNKAIASSGQEMHGFQQDAHGDIWHFYVQSGSSKSAQAGQTTYNTIDWYGPEYVSGDKVVMRILATSLIVDNNSGIIVDSFRREDLKTYEPIGVGVLKVSYTSKSFDSHGQARDLQNGYSIYRLASRFQPYDREGEQDYKQMFKDFLANEKLHELMPK